MNEDVVYIYLGWWIFIYIYIYVYADVMGVLYYTVLASSKLSLQYVLIFGIRDYGLACTAHES